MKTYIKFLSIVLCGALVCGCSMNENNADGKTNESNMEQPKAPTDDENTNIDDMMSYLKDNGVEYSDMENLTDMDFAAHEGRSFMSNGTTAYMYRMNKDDASMSELLRQASEDGIITANQNGQQKQYQASVNGNYLLVYDGEMTDMSDMKKIFADYEPNTTIQDPNRMGPSNGTNNEPME